MPAQTINKGVHIESLCDTFPFEVVNLVGNFIQPYDIFWVVNVRVKSSETVHNHALSNVHTFFVKWWFLFFQNQNLIFPMTSSMLPVLLKSVMWILLWQLYHYVTQCRIQLLHAKPLQGYCFLARSDNEYQDISTMVWKLAVRSEQRRQKELILRITHCLC